MWEEPPTAGEWRGLYGAAVAFRDLRPWEWMDGSDVFGVVGPWGGGVGYCSVTGREGAPPALQVHRRPGPPALRTAAVPDGSDDIMALILGWDFLVASFVDRGELERRDLAVVRALGLRFRGRSAWPMFRSHRPGYLPWHLAGGEARDLTVALGQAMVVSRAARADASVLRDGAGRLLHRVPGGAPGAWRDELRERPAAPALPRGELPDPEGARAGVRAARRLHGATWEVDVFPARAAGEASDGRPYIAHVILWFDRGAGSLMRTEVVEPSDVARSVPVMTHSTVVLAGAPDAVLVAREEVRLLLEPLLEGTGVRLEVAPRLPGVERARAVLEQGLGGDRPAGAAGPGPRRGGARRARARSS